LNLPALIRKCLLDFSVPRYRDRRAFYASEATKCRRDLYWDLTGVEQDPDDFIGMFRMSLGSWIEQGLVRFVLQNLHFFGLHLVGTQIQVGLSEPVKVDGNIDAMLCERVGDKFGKPIVLEVKTKYGFGGDIMARELKISEDHLAQIGIYLRDLTEKNVTSEGILLYAILSDNSFGALFAFRVRYDKSTGLATAYEVQSVDGTTKPINQTVDINAVLSRLVDVQKAVAEKKCPAPDFHYKLPLTPEVLAVQSDYTIKQALDGKKIIGNWQAIYHGFLSQRLKVDGTTREYTAEEKAILQAEHARRQVAAKARSAEKRKATVAAKKAAKVTTALGLDAVDDGDDEAA
jgi:hypothetical protein